MICKFCNRNIEIEITEKAETWGVVQERKCPKCNGNYGIKILGYNREKKELKLIKEILNEGKYKELIKCQKNN